MGDKERLWTDALEESKALRLDLAAACVRPQIKTLEERVATYNRRYAALVAALAVFASAFQAPASALARNGEAMLVAVAGAGAGGRSATDAAPGAV